MKVRAAAVVLVQGVALGAMLWRAMPVVRAGESPGGGEPRAGAKGWDAGAAARYLDAREMWWQGWKPAQKDHGTVCVSCHTTVPYAMARPVLRESLRERAAPAEESRLRESVATRVRGWGEMTPFYSDAEDGPGKTAQSHATEAVLNAVVLASYDRGKAELEPVTVQALESAWALQEEAGTLAGGWIWQDFHLAPWESGDAGYQGAALLMESLGGWDGAYLRQAGVRRHLELLRSYLRRGYAAQPVLNRLYVLWAAQRTPDLLTAGEQRELIAEVMRAQGADGGWRLCALGRGCQEAGRPELAESDGYATALVVLATHGVRESEAGRGGAAGQVDAAGRARAVRWLREHQRAEGDWRAPSMNKARVAESNIGRFMSDAATAYAVLALSGERDEARADEVGMGRGQAAGPGL